MQVNQSPFTGFSTGYVSKVQEAYENNDHAPVHEFLGFLSSLAIQQTITRNKELNNHVYTLLNKLSKGPLRKEIQKCEATRQLLPTFLNDGIILCKGGVRVPCNELELHLESEFFATIGQTAVGNSNHRMINGKFIINLSDTFCATVLNTYINLKRGCINIDDLNADCLARLYKFSDFVRDDPLAKRCIDNLVLAIEKMEIGYGELEKLLRTFEAFLQSPIHNYVVSMSAIAICRFFKGLGYTALHTNKGYKLSVNATGFLKGEGYLTEALNKFLVGLIVPYSFKMEQLPMLKTIDEKIRNKCESLKFLYLNADISDMKVFRPFQQIFPNAVIHDGLSPSDITYSIDHDPVRSYGFTQVSGFFNKEHKQIDLSSIASSFSRPHVVKCEDIEQLRYLPIPRGETYILFVDKNNNVLLNLGNNFVLSDPTESQYRVRGLYQWGDQISKGVLLLN